MSTTLSKGRELRIPGVEVPLKLEKGMSGHVRESRAGRVSVTLHGYGSSINVRERSRGGLELRAPWLPGVTGRKSDRLSTGTADWSAALGMARETLRSYYEARQQAASHGSQPPDGPLTLHQAIRIIRRKGLVPGDTQTERGKRTRRQYEFVLDLAETVYTEDPPLPLRQEHIDRMYEVRARLEGSGGDSQNDHAGVDWPKHVENRKALRRVDHRTVQKNLEDLRTVMRTLTTVRGAGGRTILSEDPMAGLKLGDHRAAIRGTAGRLQFGLVLASADRATERMRDEGLKVTERRLRNGTYHTVHTRKRLPDVIPGQLKAMLAHQYAHPTRPRSWQHVRMADLALDRESLFALVDALSLRKGEWSPPRDEVVDLWKDGAIAYRREWSKLDTERLVPVGAEFRVILDEWLERREAALRELGVESPWLYPSPRNPEEPISDTDARLLLTKGETVAREELKRKGHNAVEYVPDLPAARWYAYRRAWKANRNELGWEGSLSAAYVGDWSTNEGRTPDTVYARVSPRLILAVVEGKTLAEATAQEDAVRAVKEAARIVPVDLETLGAADRSGSG